MAATAEEFFDYFKEHKPQAKLDGIAYWLVEGDLLMDENELWAYAIERAAMDADDQGESREGLMAATSADKRIIRWRQGKVLTYFVRHSTFPSDAHYQTVVDNMRKATNAWEAVCGVKFKHLVELDKAANVGPDAALFDVICVPASQVTEKTKTVLASAFFPDKPKESRHVRVFPFYFTQQEFDPVGVFRHELGHVLGFRHEQIRLASAKDCGDEKFGLAKSLTPYDSKSVMHYLCGNGGDKNLPITEVDRFGAQRVYGLPFHEVDERD